MDAQIAGWRDAGMRVDEDQGHRATQSPNGTRIAAARRAAGDDVDLMIDANGACSRKQALAMAAVAAEVGAWYGSRSRSLPTTSPACA